MQDRDHHLDRRERTGCRARDRRGVQRTERHPDHRSGALQHHGRERSSAPAHEIIRRSAHRGATVADRIYSAGIAGWDRHPRRNDERKSHLRADESLRAVHAQGVLLQRFAIAQINFPTVPPTSAGERVRQRSNRPGRGRTSVVIAVDPRCSSSTRESELASTRPQRKSKSSSTASAIDQHQRPVLILQTHRQTRRRRGLSVIMVRWDAWKIRVGAASSVLPGGC